MALMNLKILAWLVMVQLLEVSISIVVRAQVDDEYKIKKLFCIPLCDLLPLRIEKLLSCI